MRLLLALPFAVALWLTVHFSGYYPLAIIFELLILLAYTSALLSIIFYGNEHQRGFAIGAILSPIAFVAFALRHSPFDGAMLAIVEGDRLGPILFDVYYRIWWILIWLPTSLALGTVSLVTQKQLKQPDST